MIIDGAHNPNCFEALITNLDTYFPNTKRNYVFGCLNTKDYKKMLSYIEADENLNKLYIYQFNNPNSVSYETIKSILDIKSEQINSLKDIVSDKEILTVICGSFYMINELIDRV